MHDFYISLHFFQEKVLKYVEARNNFLQFDFHFFFGFFSVRVSIEWLQFISFNKESELHYQTAKCKSHDKRDRHLVSKVELKSELKILTFDLVFFFKLH